QNSKTSALIFKPLELVYFISQIMSLYPGDVIATGTPPGVGPLHPGDVVEIEIENVGILRNYVQALE
ncbi:MAG: fumarylacetoacetate hydrolase family protein, partial [Caldimicrobium sp.]